MSFFAPGTVVDETYTIIRQIGEGGMGTVYTAKEAGLDRLVALKVLHPTLVGNQENQQRFFREGQVLATLSHPHIIKLYRFGIWQKKWPYIAMEYVDGLALRTLLEDGQRLPVSRCLKIASRICTAMQSAHSAGVTHRDLTPSNIILLKQDPDPDYPKVIDFGLSLFQPSDRTTKQQLTSTGALVGTIFYMSPEQCSGVRADHRADIYSLGCILYQMLTGKPPFQAENPIGLMRKHTTEQPAPLSEHLRSEEIPAGLENVILHAMAKDPSNRYKSMVEFKHDLDMVQSGQGHGISAPAQKNAVKKHKIANVVLVCLACTLLVTLSGTALLGRQQPGSIKESTNQGESSAPLRRLKNIASYSSAEKKVQYLRSWLEHYGSSVSIDSATARFQLAKLLRESNTDTIEINRYLDDAAEVTKQVFKSNWNSGKGDKADAAIILLNHIRTEGNAKKTLKKELLQMLPLLQSSTENGTVRALNQIRTDLTNCYMEEGNYKAATQLLTANLETAERCSMTGTERFDATVNLCICYQKCGEKAALLNQFKSAYLISEQIVPTQGVQGKVSLAIMFAESQMPRFCIEEFKMARRCGFEELSQERLGQLYIAAAKSFVQLNQPQDAMDLLNSTIDSSPPAVAMPLLDALVRLNFSAKMHKTEELSIVLDRLLSDERYKDYTDAIMALVYLTEDRSFFNESRSLAERHLRRFSKPRDWEHLAPGKAAYHLSVMAVRYQRLGLYKEAESLFDRAGSILDANPPEQNSAGRLAHDGGKACLLGAQNRYEEALQLCDQVLAEHPGEPPIPDVGRTDFLQIKGRILLKLKRLDSAEKTLTQYHELCKKIDRQGAVAAALIDLSNVSFERGDFKTSEKYLLEARDKYPAVDPDVRQNVLLALSNVYIRLKDDAKAAQSLDQYVALNGPYSNSTLNDIAVKRYAAIEKRAGKTGKEAELRAKLALPKS